MRALPLLVLLPLLAGCSGDWDSLVHFGSAPREGAPPARVAAAAPFPGHPGAQPAPPAPDPFCLAVAREDATENGFDSATQQRVAVRSYAQCVRIFGDNAGR